MADGRQSQVVVITGASSGIGLEAAKLFAARGDRVVLCARRTERLEALRTEIAKAGGESLIVPLDLADVSAAPSLIAEAEKAFGRVDVLVNNAGFGRQCRFEDMTDADIQRMFAVNLFSPMALSRAAAKGMRARRSGSIVNVSSVAGVVASPLNAVYCSTKHALVGFSRALRLELKGTGVRVTAVLPGSTATEFFDVATTDLPFGKLITAFQAPARKVAKVIVRASRGNRATICAAFDAWLLWHLDRTFPRLSGWGNVMYRDSVFRQAKRSRG